MGCPIALSKEKRIKQNNYCIHRSPIAIDIRVFIRMAAFLRSFNNDFFVGVGSVVVVYMVKTIYDLLTYPSVSETQRIASLPIANKLGDDTAITVWGFDLPGENTAYEDGVMDMSPYVNRVEAYLHLKKATYTKAKTHGLNETPRKRAPFANVTGVMVDDSSRILRELKEKLKDDTDSKLTDKQRSEGTLIRALLFGRLYFGICHFHMGTIEGQAEFRSMLAKEIPSPILPFVVAMIFRNQHATMKGSGFGHLPHLEICEVCREGLTALAVLLGPRLYILDTTEATVCDTDVFAFVAPFFFEPLMADLEFVRDVREKHPIFVDYVNRMRDLLYPALKKKQE